MSTKRTVSIVAALLVVGLATLLLFNLKPSGPKANASTLPFATQQTLADADRPVVVVVTGANCTTCPDLLKQVEAQVSKHPEVTFVQADALAFQVPEKNLPLLVVVVPGLPMPSYAQANFTSPADFDAFIKQRVGYAVEEHTKVKAVLALQDQVTEAEKPFVTEATEIEKNRKAALAPIQQRAAEATKDLKAQAEEINGRLQKALGTLPQELQNAKTIDEAIAIQAKIEEIAKPFQVELLPIQSKAAEVLRPFREEAAKAQEPFAKQMQDVQKRRDEALKDLDAQLSTAEEELLNVLESHQAPQSGGEQK